MVFTRKYGGNRALQVNVLDVDTFHVSHFDEAEVTDNKSCIAFGRRTKLKR